MPDLPDFPLAFERFQAFLASFGHPTPVRWYFRDDLWLPTFTSAVISSPVPSRNQPLAMKVYHEGRAAGLVELLALARAPKFTVATVWFPKFPDDAIQGWSENLKLSIREPLPLAHILPRLTWPILWAVPAFRRFQATYSFIGTRSWAESTLLSGSLPTTSG